jgi:peptidoglycan/xylan/chitin deacetylase (PgdA/CDA1 family)
MFFILAAIFLTLALVIFWIEPFAALDILERLTPNIVYRTRTDEPVVALSFDDGPHPVFTPMVLDILETHQARATFFLIGERALRHPDLVQQIKDAVIRSPTTTSETERLCWIPMPNSAVICIRPNSLPDCPRQFARRSCSALPAD